MTEGESVTGEYSIVFSTGAVENSTFHSGTLFYRAHHRIPHDSHAWGVDFCYMLSRRWVSPMPVPYPARVASGNPTDLYWWQECQIPAGIYPALRAVPGKQFARSKLIPAPNLSAHG
jgi:hypothetical protein